MFGAGGCGLVGPVLGGQVGGQSAAAAFACANQFGVSFHERPCVKLQRFNLLNINLTKKICKNQNSLSAS